MIIKNKIKQFILNVYVIGLNLLFYMKHHQGCLSPHVQFENGTLFVQAKQSCCNPISKMNFNGNLCHHFVMYKPYIK